jgi:hypothetical protein
MPSQSPSGRLDLVLHPTSEEVFEPDAVSDAPLVRFVAYADHQRIFGWVRLTADRLTDLLNAHEELHLADAEMEDLDDGVVRPVDDLVIRCRELIAVDASGPRGDATRRRPTRRHPIAIQSGSYLIGGHLHASPGSDPLASAGSRPAMFPLTDAWIEYWSGDERKHESTGTILVNRDRTDWMRIVTDDDLIDERLRPRASGDRRG